VTFDVYDRAGKPVAIVELSAATAEQGAVNTPVHTPFVVRGNQVYMVIFDEDDNPHVIRYEIVR
jgi:hypothetical protein